MRIFYWKKTLPDSVVGQIIENGDEALNQSFEKF